MANTGLTLNQRSSREWSKTSCPGANQLTDIRPLPTLASLCIVQFDRSNLGAPTDQWEPPVLLHY
ncbi:hypothetical protein M514_03405 [Trichuris suis]|uniref:Uncharacterized protein n=1 Tax=Trichuris suis TaxID=68888 RepID=A0A085MEL1_9BILA|nr:hypothetical protein M513_03405 [Trichuris suis]KFD68069.1 hypothetical protein M514_03405 [Trichuris suis]